MSTPWIFVRQIEVREDGKVIEVIPIETLYHCKCFECRIPMKKLEGRNKAELWLIDYNCDLYSADECPPNKIEVRMKVLTEDKERNEAVLVDYDAPDDVVTLTVH